MNKLGANDDHLRFSTEDTLASPRRMQKKKKIMTGWS